jgi:hypothetical protein
MKSHIDQVALDNLLWESSAGSRLESSDAVRFYARNDHMGKRRDRGAGAFHICRNSQLLDKEMEYLAHTLRGEP